MDNLRAAAATLRSLQGLSPLICSLFHLKRSGSKAALHFRVLQLLKLLHSAQTSLALMRTCCTGENFVLDAKSSKSKLKLKAKGARMQSA